MAVVLSRSSKSSGRRIKSRAEDLSTVEGLVSFSERAGLGKQAKEIVPEKPKMSALQRLSSALGSFNPAEAILTGQEKKSFLSGAGKYVAGIGQGLAGAVTGKNYQGERRTFSDVAEKLGIENRVAKFGVGFLGDVLLDPTTYFGGAIAKGIGAVTKGTVKGAVKGISKVSPEAGVGLEMVGEGLKDALGRAFSYGYKSTLGAKGDVLSFLTSKHRVRMEIAADNLNRLGPGVLTKAQREELSLKLIAGKRAEFFAREAGKTIDEAGRIGINTALKDTTPEVQKLIVDQSARSKALSLGADIENPYESYFPFIRSDKIQKFLVETRGIRVGSEGYRKQFKNLLTNENMELDPAKAFFTREAQVATDAATKTFLTNFVKGYGKPLSEFATADEAAKAGYQLIKEKGIFGKDVGYLNKWDAALIRDSISPEFQTFSMLAKATGFDAVTSLFKRSVTGLFLPFHIRNYVSGVIQNFEVLGLGALNPKNIAIGQKVAYMIAKGQKLPPEMEAIWKPFVERFSGDTFFNSEFDIALKSGYELNSAAGLLSKQRLGTTFKTAGLGTEAIPFKVGRAVGQFIEHQQKATAYITAIGQGKTVKEAMLLAEAAGFDYRALTAFESQIMRRIIPFYSFTRKNIELQLKTLKTNPQRINQVLKFFENSSSLFGGHELTEEERADLPGFIKEAIGVRLEDSPDGLKQYISSFGTPIEAFTQLFGSNPVLRGISQMNPLLKTPIEIGIGKDSFRQRDLKDVYDASEYKGMPGVLKDLLEIKEVKKDVLKKGADGKLKKVGQRTQYVADPTKLLIARSLFTSRGITYLDQVFGNDLQGLVKALKLTTGIKPQQIDLEQQRGISESIAERALADMLKKYGEVGVINKPFEINKSPKLK